MAVAVDEDTGDAYVLEKGTFNTGEVTDTWKLNLWSGSVVPDVRANSASAVTHDGAMLNGHVGLAGGPPASDLEVPIPAGV